MRKRLFAVLVALVVPTLVLAQAPAAQTPEKTAGAAWNHQACVRNALPFGSRLDNRGP